MSILKAVDLSVTYGNTSESAYLYSIYGAFNCGRLYDIEAGTQFGKLSLDLLRKLNAKEMLCRIYQVFYGLISYWTGHIGDSLRPLRAAYESALEVGDLEYAGYSALFYCNMAFSAGIGNDLLELDRDVMALSKSMYQLKQMIAFRQFQILKQALHDVREVRAS